jgi:hypothetical protein
MLGKLTIKELCDKAAISELLERYWFGLDVPDVDIATSVFTPDAQYGDRTGIDAIREAVSGIHKFRALSHANANSMITVDGDTAHAESYALSFLVENIGGEEKVTVRGLRYVDELVRTPDGWRISRRHGGVEPPVPHVDLWQFRADSIETIVATLARG